MEHEGEYCAQGKLRRSAGETRLEYGVYQEYPMHKKRTVIISAGLGFFRYTARKHIPKSMRESDLGERAVIR